MTKKRTIKSEQLSSADVVEELDLTEIEVAAEEAKQQFGKDFVDRALKQLSPENNRPKACPRCGKSAPVRARDVERSFQSLSGSHTIRRNYHYCEDCKKGFFPRDIQLGLPEHGDLSPELEKRVLDFAVNDPYSQAARRWTLHYRSAISSNQVRQVVKRVGTQAETADPSELQRELLAPSSKPPDLLYVLNDGSQLPMVHGKWSEAKVGVVFREDRASSSPDGERSGARYVAVLGGQDEFAKELKSAVAVERWRKARTVVWLGDGAPANWNLAQSVCLGAVEILDWPHAVEHAMNCGKVLLGEEHPLLIEWQQRSVQLLTAGNVDQFVEELMDCAVQARKRDELQAINDLIRYYRTNQHRMRYDDFRRRGFLIGSGIVESAHRHVLQVRMKRAGQHWSQHHGERMVRLRAAYRTAGPHRFHRAIRNAYRRSLSRALGGNRP
jgi:hypothetical protein